MEEGHWSWDLKDGKDFNRRKFKDLPALPVEKAAGNGREVGRGQDASSGQSSSLPPD